MTYPDSRRFHLTVLSLLAGLTLTAPSFADATPTASAAEANADLSQELNHLFAAAYPADQPGATVLVRRGSEILLHEGYGMADLELDVAIEPHMIFRIGSITKQFTAVAVLMLVEDGKLSLDQTIRQVLPDYPETHGDKITVEQLLTHVSGIPSYTDQAEFWEIANDDASVDERVAFFSDKELEFGPGSQWKYNNSAYLLLGAIIEKVSGQTYSDFLQERIFTPLAMTSTSYGDAERIVKGRVEGYQPEGEGFRIADYISMDWPYSAGSLLSSVADLERWDRALYGDQLLPQSALQTAWTSAKLNDGSQTGYGYGWSVGEVGGHKIIEHGGGIHGFRTHGLRIPDKEIFVAVFTNGARTSPTAMARRAALMLLGQSMPGADDPVIEVAPEILESYIGVYRIDDETTRVVQLDDEGRLTTRRSDGPVSTPRPLSDTSFLYEDSLTRLDFVVENGKVVAQVMTAWGDEPERAERTDEAIPEGPQKADVDPALYNRLAGSYELMPGFALKVFRDGDRFMVQGTGQPAIESLPSSPTEFFNEQLGARIVFELDELGERAVALTLYQGGQELRGERVDE